ncbi:Thiamine biosynthesis lipoprotein ApbE precursor [Pirellulimonas nuda]|uniref:FAD:protein FMN transferase n=1 Tax=Pirellulimonas nuda TaxID=2528009 RepID=A0A518DIX5_9BACT|nr:FAD:protein FMN transferase [Pirellulimonas nuda]QDU91382.1 Thiamine biosynthesis lipoprotein ApbE precursor [Pirellulimonas nuda]
MPAPDSTRRDFLTGKAAARSLSDSVGSLGASGEGTDGACVLNVARPAMACQFEFRVLSTATHNTGPAAIEALDLVEAIEDQLTVYRDQSEVQEINRTAALHPIPVEPGLFALLEQADALYQETGGAFDLTAGPLSKAWGFFERRGRVPSEAELAAAMAHVGWGRVCLDRTEKSIQFTEPGVEINFNSIGKGYALDRAADLLAERGAPDVLLHGGGSTLVARGQNRAAGVPGWLAGLGDPLRSGRRLGEFLLRDEALSTSGAATQKFVQGGKRYGHLIDPRTGRPAEGVHSVTVLAPTGAAADALSTAFYVLGWEGAEAYCGGHADVRALFVLPTPGGGVDVRTLNLPEDAWRRYP